MKETLNYTIMDPTGNITALVESPVEISRQPYAAGLIMQKHPDVEQVGFLSSFADMPDGEAPSGDTPDICLRMAGGEFCGNASMCAAALYIIRSKSRKEKLLLRVSGSSQPVEVSLLQDSENSFHAEILMPSALSIDFPELSFGSLTEKHPVIKMEGISHIIIPQDSLFFRLSAYREDAQSAVRTWCGQLSCEGLGLMFLDEERQLLTPLVYIPGSGTVFWENSCASGTAAVGMYLAEKEGGPISLSLEEPGGMLTVSSDPRSRRTVLRGRVSLVKSAVIYL